MSKSEMRRREVMTKVPSMMGPTEIVWIMDRSGSMESIRLATQEGFNSFLAEQKGLGECFVSLYQFDHEYEAMYEGVMLDLVMPYVLHPRGNTALRDAMGRTFDTALARISDGRRVIVGISTDGQENASQHYTMPMVTALIDRARGRGWQVLFLGANQDAIATASAYHIPAANSMTYAANAVGASAAYRSASVATRGFVSGQTQTASFNAQDRKLQEEALKQGGGRS